MNDDIPRQFEDVAIFQEGMSDLTDSLIFAATNVVLYAKNAGLVRRYWRRLGRLPDIANPRRYSERMLWRKTVDHNPQFIIFSDKLATKEFIKRRCPDLPVAHVRWVGCNPDAIPDECLQGDVLVKANHGCDFNYRVRGGRWDRSVLREKGQRWLTSVYGKLTGEWGYSQVEPKLFVEEAVGDEDAGLIEFQVRASNGTAMLGSVMGHCKTPAQWFAYLDPDGNQTLGMNDPDGSPIVPSPRALAAIEPYLRAVEYTRRLSVGVDYARFDFMWNGQDLFGGEITVYPAAGIMDPVNSQVQAATLHGWDLLQAHFLKTTHTGWTQRYADALKRRLKSRHPQSAPGNAPASLAKVEVTNPLGEE
ncbi:MAG: hypothetical protein IT579_09385 [Verrucomicrobia subdivision 3 bacterium]|nr:hypothetical protein [Limisphaerales bacterium]